MKNRHQQVVLMLFDPPDKLERGIRVGLNVARRLLLLLHLA
jgi:hypothetical protein